MKPLYELVTQHRELAALDPEECDEEALRTTLEGLQGEITLKATSVAAYIRNAEIFADSVEEAAKGLQERAKRVRSRTEWLKSYLLGCMKLSGITKIQSVEFTVAVRKNLAAIHIEPDAVIPEDFMVYPPPPSPHPDKRALKKAIEEGQEIEGVRLEQSERLDIRS
jgi:Siphovirus Gp157